MGGITSSHAWAIADCSIAGWLLLGCIVTTDNDASQFVICVCRGGTIIRGGNDGYVS